MLLKQFGLSAILFSETGMQSLLDLEDKSSPVVLMQLIAVADSDEFDLYETEIAAVRDQFSAQQIFASRVIGQLIGERSLTEVRAIEFANAAMLIDAIGSDTFAAAMATLSAASNDQSWVLGYRGISLDLKGGFFDPRLQLLDREDALQLLAEKTNQASSESTLESNPEPIIDMIVSDSPEPFYMVNLIKHYEQANYPDGRQSDLTGEEAKRFMALLSDHS